MEAAAMLRAGWKPDTTNVMTITNLDDPLYQGCVVVKTENDGQGSLLTVLLYVARGQSADFLPPSTSTWLVDLPGGFRTPLAGILAAIANGVKDRPPPPVHV